jgi:hypothetical protein
MKGNNSQPMRIDDELEKQIREFASKNNLKIKEASRQMAMLNKVKFTDKKILKEIKF